VHKFIQVLKKQTHSRLTLQSKLKYAENQAVVSK